MIKRQAIVLLDEIFNLFDYTLDTSNGMVDLIDNETGCIEEADTLKVILDAHPELKCRIAEDIVESIDEGEEIGAWYVGAYNFLNNEANIRFCERISGKDIQKYLEEERKYA